MLSSYFGSAPYLYAILRREGQEIWYTLRNSSYWEVYFLFFSFWVVLWEFCTMGSDRTAPSLFTHLCIFSSSSNFKSTESSLWCSYISGCVAFHRNSPLLGVGELPLLAAVNNQHPLSYRWDFVSTSTLCTEISVWPELTQCLGMLSQARDHVYNWLAVPRKQLPYSYLPPLYL